MSGSSNGFVRWRELIPILITIFSMTVAIAIGAIYMHGQAPHSDAIHKREFSLFEKNVNLHFDLVHKKLDEMAEDIRQRHQHLER